MRATVTGGPAPTADPVRRRSGRSGGGRRSAPPGSAGPGSGPVGRRVSRRRRPARGGRAGGPTSAAPGSARSGTRPAGSRAARRTRPGCWCCRPAGWSPASTGSSRPSVRGTQGATRSTGASMTTSTSYSQPTARWSSSSATGSRPVGGVNPAGSSSAAATRSIRKARRRPGGVRPAQQVPPAVPDDDRPRVDLGAPLRAGLRPVAQPDPAVLRARLHQRGGDLRVGPGGGAVRGRRGRHPDRLGLPGHRLGQRAQQLAQGAADRVRGVGGLVVAVEHGHHQPERLGRGEHQRRQPDAATDPVAAVPAADRLDRDAGLAQDADVAAGGPLGDAELVGEPVGGDARAALHQLQGEQRPCGRAGVLVHRRPLHSGT